MRIKMRHNYQLHHVLIALAVQTVLIALGGDHIVASAVPVIFYGMRELYQYSHLKIKPFDWGGIVPVAIAMILSGVGYALQ